MKFTVNRTELLAAAQNAERIAPRVSTIEILQCAYLQAEQDTLTVASGNLGDRVGAAAPRADRS